MITKKKILKEDAEQPIDETAAADSVKANSKPADDPKSKYSRIADMIGAAFAMTDHDLEKFHNQTIARAKEIGHGVGVGNNAESNRSTLNMHPSAASHVKEAVKSDIEKIISEQDGLSEEFKLKAITLFETALEARVTAALLEIEEQYDERLTEEVQEIADTLAKGVQTYLDYAADDWLEENKVAIESTLRNELAEDIIEGVRKVMTENNIVIPEEQVEVVESMAEKIDELEARLNDAIAETTELRDALGEAKKDDVVRKVSEGLTLDQATKLAELAESVEAENFEEFETKLNTIKESQFVKEGKSATTLTESLEEVDEDNAPTPEKVYTSPEMKRYAQALGRSLRR